LQVVVCGYRNKVVYGKEVYPLGVACKTDEAQNYARCSKKDGDCTFYPSTCHVASGLCVPKVTPPPYGRLRVDGPELLGENGQPVQLRGMSLFGTNKAGRCNFYNRDAITALKCNWKTNAIRAVMDAGRNGNGTEGGGYIYFTRPEYAQPDQNVDLVTVEKAIKASIELGIYVVIDWHNSGYFPIQHFKSSALGFWKYIAKKYKAFPHVLCEAYNEPVYSPKRGIDDQWARDIKPYHEDVIKTIRAIDRRGVILLGTQGYSSRVDIAAADPIQGHSNLCYVAHFYAYPPSNVATLTDRITTARNANLCVFITEYGTTKGDGVTNYDPVSMQGMLMGNTRKKHI
jgi:endoglucanase